MKYTLYVNQEKAINLGITNINQGLILDFLTTISAWASPVEVDGETYYWVARQKIADELPLLKLKPDTVYRHIKKLAEIGVIDYTKLGKKDCLRLSEKGKNYLSDTMSEINPNHYVGNKSELPQNSEINPSKLGNKSEKNSEINPTYKTTNIYTTTKDTITPHTPLISFDDFWNCYPRKTNRDQAEKSWTKLKPDKQLFDQIILNIERRLQLGDWSLDRKNYIPHAATYLNGKRWQDEIIPRGENNACQPNHKLSSVGQVNANLKRRSDARERVIQNQRNESDKIRVVIPKDGGLVRQ